MNAKLARLLIVTSNSDDSRLFRDYLEDDYDLLVISRGAEALQRLEQASDIDLALLAGALPDMGVLQLVSAIRDRHSAGNLPLIMLEGDGGPDEVALAFQYGADNCLMRPFTAAALKARIDALLELKRSFDRTQAKSAELVETDLQRLLLCRMASHDLQSPLNNIRLAVKNMQNASPGDGGEVNDSLEMIRLMAENMGEIMSNYLDVMELNSDQLSYKLKPVYLRDVIVNVASQFELAAREKNIQLQIRSAEGWVIADATRLVQALGNLLSNAIKYSPHGSAVTLDTVDEDGFSWLIVEDQGPGILPAERARLFQEFGKLSTHPTGGESRTGLGLWIVKQLVEAQEGVVGAEFPESGGSRFRIGLPTATDLSGGEAPPAA